MCLLQVVATNKHANDFETTKIDIIIGLYIVWILLKIIYRADFAVTPIREKTVLVFLPFFPSEHTNKHIFFNNTT